MLPKLPVVTCFESEEITVLVRKRCQDTPLPGAEVDSLGTLPMVVTVQSINRNEDTTSSAGCEPVEDRREWPPVRFPTRLEELINNEEKLANYSEEESGLIYRIIGNSMI